MLTTPDDAQADDEHQPPDDEEAAEVSALREECARWLSVVAIALFIMGPIMLLTVWLSAKQGGNLPDWEKWGPGNTNHGPWHPSQNLWHLNYGFDKALALPCYAFLVAGASYFAKPNLRAIIVLAASVLFVVISTLVFIPLFD